MYKCTQPQLTELRRQRQMSKKVTRKGQKLRLGRQRVQCGSSRGDSLLGQVGCQDAG